MNEGINSVSGHPRDLCNKTLPRVNSHSSDHMYEYFFASLFFSTAGHFPILQFGTLLRPFTYNLLLTPI